ncbi:hypothetical protein ALP8811_00998 [Aliiroseovarius pelagivivens]|uniref:YjiS-like domain-containing protein n=1 Tax=Aliiroseovarius pelagivivens TaxID=1639690 RepID=A0A2R8AIX8_9RHOB|nr:DUF1127 domain-containing protein [Aliiroseovarius pelagivivens]SPF76002.1 hypothetical protein ALP8811_00998 [Aliiroseovarius pelagivivens]
MTTTILNFFTRPILQAETRNSKPQWRSYSREAADLLSMEDWMLNDIGISRATAVREARRLQRKAATEWMGPTWWRLRD